MAISGLCKDLRTVLTDTSDDDGYTMVGAPGISVDALVGGESVYPSMTKGDYRVGGVRAQYHRGIRLLHSNLRGLRLLAAPAITRIQATPIIPGRYVNKPTSSFPTGESSKGFHAVKLAAEYSIGPVRYVIPTKYLNVRIPPVTTLSNIRPWYRQGQSSQVERTHLRRIKPPSSRNIIVFGETGTGKSSLINMLANDQVAPISNRAVGCTFHSAQYPVIIGGTQYNFWDTVGLDEAEEGSVPPEEALNHLVKLVGLRDGISLLVYCIRGSRYRNILEINYTLFAKIICQGKVPVVVVVTGLENEQRMENWWVVNEWYFKFRNMEFAGHACVITTKGKRNIFEQQYEESKEVVRALIQNQCPDDAWAVQDPEAWLKQTNAEIQTYKDNHNNHLGTANAIEGRPDLHLLNDLANRILMDMGRVVNVHLDNLERI